MKIKTVKNFFKSLITYLLLGLISLIFCLPVVLSVCLPARWRYDNRFHFWLMRLISWCAVRSTFVPITVLGKENIPHYPNNPSIFVINHSSSFDIPLVEMLTNGFPRVWLSKDYSKIPVLGFVLKRMHIVVSFAGIKKPLSAIKAAYKLTHNKLRHLCIFPEGRRYNDGNIHEFYPGFAIFAEMLNRPVIPILLVGLDQIYPKNSWLFKSEECRISVVVGKPFYHKDYATREEFLDKVSNWFKLEKEKLSSPSL